MIDLKNLPPAPTHWLPGQQALFDGMEPPRERVVLPPAGLPMTEEDILAARTQAGGWTRAQLAQWEIEWPPPHGWKQRVIGKVFR